MTRAVAAFLLLLSSWLLLSTPALGVHGASARAVAVVTLQDEARAGGETEHVAAQSATPEVPRAPLLGRLPAVDVAVYAASSSPSFERPERLGDRREALRRVQLRRRVPRLGGGEPPWS